VLLRQNSAHLDHRVRLPLHKGDILVLRVLDNRVAGHLIVGHNPIVCLGPRPDHRAIKDVGVERGEVKRDHGGMVGVRWIWECTEDRGWLRNPVPCIAH